MEIRPQKTNFLLASALTVPHAIPFFPIRIVPDPLAPSLPGAYCLEVGSFEVGRKRRGGKWEEKAFFFPHLSIRFPAPPGESRNWVI